MRWYDWLVLGVLAALAGAIGGAGIIAVLYRLKRG